MQRWLSLLCESHSVYTNIWTFVEGEKLILLLFCIVAGRFYSTVAWHLDIVAREFTHTTPHYLRRTDTIERTMTYIQLTLHHKCKIHVLTKTSESPHKHYKCMAIIAIVSLTVNVRNPYGSMNIRLVPTIKNFASQFGREQFVVMATNEY